MQCSRRVGEGTTTWRVWTCWPEADATWASVCNWTAVTPPCCWEQEQERAWNVSGGKWTTRRENTLPLGREGGKSFQKGQTPSTESVFVEDSRITDSSPLNLCETPCAPLRKVKIAVISLTQTIVMYSFPPKPEIWSLCSCNYCSFLVEFTKNKVIRF